MSNHRSRLSTFMLICVIGNFCILIFVTAIDLNKYLTFKSSTAKVISVGALKIYKEKTYTPVNISYEFANSKHEASSIIFGNVSVGDIVEIQILKDDPKGFYIGHNDHISQYSILTFILSLFSYFLIVNRKKISTAESPHSTVG